MEMKINSIQFLRATAAILVVYAHSIGMQANYSVSGQQNFFHLKNFGCIGVDLFFVISGFIITFISSKYIGPNSSINFITNRFLRINPIYYIASIIYLPILILIAITNNPISSITDSILNSLSDTILIIPISSDVHSYLPILVVGWTLSYEWLFYLLFSILLLFRTKYNISILLFFIILIITLGTLFNFSDYRIMFLTNPIMLEFVFGIIICSIYQSKIKIPLLLSSFLLSSGIISYLLLILYGYGNIWLYTNILNGESSMQRFLLWGIPSAFIVAGSTFLEKRQILDKLWSNKIIGIIGNASYSIYLTHLTAFILFNLLYKQIHAFISADLSIILRLCTSIIFGIAFFKTVEKPLLQIFRKKKYKNPPPNFVTNSIVFND